MSIRKTSARRVAAAVGALALVMTGTFMGPVSAAPGAEGTPPGEASDGTTGSLTVHKRVGAQTGAHNGTDLGTGAPGDPLENVTFSAQMVGLINASGVCEAIDLTTTAGWETAQLANAVPAPALAAAEVGNAGKLCGSGTVWTDTTDVDGLAGFSDLPIGLYYVQETNAPANVVETAVPFYVSIPFASTSGEDTTWLYDVHVYPKNAVADAPTKKIGDRPSSVVIGGKVTWTIAQKIPAIEAAQFTDASIQDTLDPRLTLVSSTVAIVTDPLAEPTAAEILPGGDYAGPVAGDGPSLEWTLTSSGLSKLKSNPGKYLVVTVVTSVDSVISAGETAGVIDNKATVTLNDKPVDTPEAYSYWGNVVVHKADGETPLSGASFAAFEKGTGNCAATMPAISDAVAQGTSNSSGVVEWGSPADSSLGLWIANSNTVLSNPEKVYCLYETAAPAGYLKIDEPLPITVSTSAENATIETTVQNTKLPGPTLPMTGSSGTLMLTVAGIGLIGLGAGGIMLRRRSSKQN